MTFPYHIVDLTHTVDSSIPTWDGDCGFKYHITTDYSDSDAETKFRIMKFQLNANIGTHLDAPSHCICGADSVDKLSIESLCMECFVIDVSHKVDECYTVILNDILEFELCYGKISQNSCVMIKTGWDKFWFMKDKYRNNMIFPSVSEEVAELLIERGIKALGIDTLSADRPDHGYPVHQIFLANRKILIENVTNLNMIPPTGTTILAFPLKIKDATESPIRLVSLIPQI